MILYFPVGYRVSICFRPSSAPPGAARRGLGLRPYPIRPRLGHRASASAFGSCALSLFRNRNEVGQSAHTSAPACARVSLLRRLVRSTGHTPPINTLGQACGPAASVQTNTPQRRDPPIPLWRPSCRPGPPLPAAPLPVPPFAGTTRPRSTGAAASRRFAVAPGSAGRAQTPGTG